MELKVIRKIKTPNSTIGDFLIDGIKKFVTLEDVDRGLTSAMTLAKIAAIKVKTETAIPTGRYKVTSYFSPKHNAIVPLVNDVPGFEGIEIHIGNYAKDTDGCLLLGTGLAPDMITGSKDTIDQFYPIVFETLKNEDVFITYQ